MTSAIPVQRSWDFNFALKIVAQFSILVCLEIKCMARWIVQLLHKVELTSTSHIEYSNKKYATHSFQGVLQ